MTEKDPIDIHADYLHHLADASPFRLAEIAGCASPDRRDSPAAEYLEEIRDAVVRAWTGRRFDWESDRDDRSISNECAEAGIVPAYSHEAMELGLDLIAYAEKNEHTTRGEWTGSIEEIMRDAIAQIGERAAAAFIAELRVDFDDLFVCPGCGDTGKPHLCLPGQCGGSEEAQEAYRASQATAEPADTVTQALGIHPRAEAVSEAPGAASDPLMQLLLETRAELGSSPADIADMREPYPLSTAPSDTQAFMSRMDAINAEEFAKRPSVLALVGYGLLGVGVVAFLVALLVMVG